MTRSLLFIVVLAHSVCSAQVTGTFSLEKAIFAPREPVFLDLTLVNRGAEAVEVVTADSYSFCSGYRIEITRPGAPRVECYEGYAGSCMSGAVTLAPHESHTEHILLNYPENSRGDLHPPVKVPGDYVVDAFRSISYAPLRDAHLFDRPSHAEVHQIFDVHVDGTLEVPASVYAPFVERLGSKEDAVRREAARVLATVAPPALEPLLLGFATSKDDVLREFAPLALSNLATKASFAALADLVAHAASGTYEAAGAAEFLGKTHDPTWFPALLDAADRHGASYLSYAAQSGGELALPALQARLDATKPGMRDPVILALGSTHSRAAIPMLIGLLRPVASRDGEGSLDEASAANEALRQLTHRYVAQPLPTDWVTPARQQWQQWWAMSGRDAEVFWPGDCVADRELP